MYTSSDIIKTVLLSDKKSKTPLPKDMQSLLSLNLIISNESPEQALIIASSLNRLDWIRILMDEYTYEYKDIINSINEATKKGNLDIVRYLYDFIDEIDDKIKNDNLKIASKGGHLELVKFWLEHGADMNDEILNDAVEIMNPDMVKYLISKGARTYNIYDSILLGFIRKRQNEYVKFILDIMINAKKFPGKKGRLNAYLIEALHSRNQNMVNFFKELGISVKDLKKEDINSLFRHNRLDINDIDLIINTRPDVELSHDKVMILGIEKDDPLLVKYAINNGSKLHLDPETFYQMIEWNSVNVFDYIIKYGFIVKNDPGWWNSVVMHGNMIFIENLLKHDKNNAIKNRLLKHAAHNSWLSEYLKERGAKYNPPPLTIRTPLSKNRRIVRISKDSK